MHEYDVVEHINCYTFAYNQKLYYSVEIGQYVLANAQLLERLAGFLQAFLS